MPSRNGELPVAGQRSGQPSGVLRQLRLAIVGVVATFGFLLASGVSPAGASASEMIAFDSDRSGNYEIYVMAPDGSQVVRLTDDPAEDRNPAFSPDGKRIAFESNRSGDWEIYAMDSDGANLVRLTNREGADLDPAFSPDGTRLAIRRDIGGGNNEVFLIDAADGGNPVNLTDNPHSDFWPTFSPDGTKIAFQRFESGVGNNVMIMNSDGTNQTSLTTGFAQSSGQPDFSPDGSRILFRSREAANQPYDVFTMAPDGSNKVQRSSSPRNEENPAWGPDSSRAVFTRAVAHGAPSPGGNPNVFTADVDPLGSGTFDPPSIINRTASPAGINDRNPDWATLDITPPVTAIDSGPADGSLITVGSVEFSFSSNETGSTFECRLDAAGWEPCVSPASYEGLDDGPHTFAVRATDPAGNTDPSPPQVTWTVDTTTPTIEIASGPGSPTNRTSASFTFVVAGPDLTLECQLDGEILAPCQSPLELTELDPGEHSLVIRLIDSGEVVGSDEWEWTILADRPAATITAGPESLTPSSDAEIAFTVDVSAAVAECRLDAGPWNDCVSPVRLEDLADGDHSFEVRSRLPGEEAGDPASHEWTVDTVAPSIDITGRPPALTNSRRAAFGFAVSEEEALVECRLDQSDWSECDREISYTGLADGSHAFLIRAIDPAGNTGTAEYRWIVDTVAPRVTIDSGPRNSTESSAEFRFTADKPGSVFVCRLDGDAWKGCESPLRIDGLTVGHHIFDVAAVDLAGNIGSPVGHTWEVTEERSVPRRPVFRIMPRVRLNRAGRGAVAIVGCPEGRCQVRVPKRIVVRRGKQRFALHVRAPRAIGAGRTARVLLVASPRARKLLRRPGRIAFAIRVNSGNGTSTAGRSRPVIVAPRAGR